MKKRFLGVYDSNGVPLFENDFVFLNLEKMKNINSYFGAFVSQLDLNIYSCEVGFDNTFPDLIISFSMKFKNNETNQYLTNKEYNKLTSKSSKPFYISENDNNAFVINTIDYHFFLSVFNKCSFSVLNDSDLENRLSFLKEQNNSRFFVFSNDIHLTYNNVIIFSRNEFIDKLFEDNINLLINDDFTDISFQIVPNTYNNFFFNINAWFSKDGIKSCYTTGNLKDSSKNTLKKLNKEFYRLKRKDLNLNKNELAKKEKEINDFYDNKDNFHPVISDSIFFELLNDVDLFNSNKSSNFNITLINELIKKCEFKII